MREVSDVEGVKWMVYEVRRSLTESDIAVPEALRGGWLCFESATHKKRIAPVPTEWRKLSDAALLELSRALTPVLKRGV